MAGRQLSVPSWPPIDWSRPWLEPYCTIGRRAEAAVASGCSVAGALQHALDGRPPIVLDAGALRFVPASALPQGIAYESFIAASACVPTRDNLHDFFNGLVWLRCPALKRRLNRQQAAAIARQGVGPVRGALRDALTLLDENGALLQAPPPLLQALRERDWPALFIRRREAWAQASLRLVGHALIEKLTAPRKAITAHVCVMAPGDELPAGFGAEPFLPLPVLGVPGWWPGNEAAGFYDDPAVFRQADSAGRKPSIDR